MEDKTTSYPFIRPDRQIALDGAPSTWPEPSSLEDRDTITVDRAEDMDGPDHRFIIRRYDLVETLDARLGEVTDIDHEDRSVTITLETGETETRPAIEVFPTAATELPERESKPADTSTVEAKTPTASPSEDAEGLIRPDRQITFPDARGHWEWPDPGEHHDRDTITVDRVSDLDGATPHRFVIKRGDTVNAWFSSKRTEPGKVVGISHANNQVRVQFPDAIRDTEGIEFHVGQIYPAAEPTPAKPDGAVPLSSIIEKVNAKHGSKLTIADRVPLPAPPRAVLKFLEEHEGKQFTDIDLREQFGQSDFNPFDPLKNEVNQSLKTLRDKGKIHVEEPDFGAARFSVLALPEKASELTQAHCPDHLTGAEVKALFRKYHQTISEFAKRCGFTQKHVREVQERGLKDQHSVRDWLEAMLPNDHPKKAAPTPQAPKQSESYTFDDHKEYVRKLQDGTVTLVEVKQGFSRLLEDKDEFIADLKKRFKADKLKLLASRLGDWNARSQNKGENAASIHRKMLMDFHLKDSFSYQMGQDPDEQLALQVLAQTDEDVTRYVESRNDAREAREKELTNPETLREFRAFIDEKGQDALSKEQLATWDKLNADLSRERRKESKQSSNVGQFQAEEIGDLELTLVEGHHSKKNIPLFIVQMGARVERSTFVELKNKAKMLGGWYSSFVKAQAGFQFYDQETAERFISLTQGDVDRTDVLEARKARKEQTASERLHELATDMLTKADETIEASKDAIQNTARRADIQAGVRGRAYASQALARSIHSIAEALSNGEANYLDGIRHRTHVESLDTVLNLSRRARVRSIKQSEGEGDFAFYERRGNEEGKPYSEDDIRHAEYPYPSLYKRHLYEAIEHCKGKSGQKQAAARMEKRLRYEKEEYVTFSEGHDIRQVTDLIARAKATGFDGDYLDRSLEQFSRLRRANIFDIHELRAALREYIPHSSSVRGDDPVQIAERELVGKKIPGFFPTPAAVIEEMLERADIGQGHRVLEPSCGKGDIVQSVKRAQPDVGITAIELNRTLEDVLSAKGIDATFGDFLEHEGAYDRILMNPPFENGADIDHVRKAVDLLAADGRLVAIMSEGPFFRSDRKAEAFREWLEELGGESEQLPENAFNGADAFRQTGVRTRIVTIGK
ncbi:hypothetical protein Enr13x_37620 [Stieleria neptunia]|uniref:Methyltransferase small domain-containing protein n=1 Tax=Stieleria neptunia TaxID=2527979 RepID=A0A518HST8_9BACT|nr:methyltransferase [Stieleria neptunia]QDV43902.1 hypothetical protein Enr13x_37620 [Stieleria neptunia]